MLFNKKLICKIITLVLILSLIFNSLINITIFKSNALDYSSYFNYNTSQATKLLNSSKFKRINYSNFNKLSDYNRSECVREQNITTALAGKLGTTMSYNSDKGIYSFPVKKGTINISGIYLKYKKAIYYQKKYYDVSIELLQVCANGSDGEIDCVIGTGQFINAPKFSTSSSTHIIFDINIYNTGTTTKADLGNLYTQIWDLDHNGCYSIIDGFDATNETNMYYDYGDDGVADYFNNYYYNENNKSVFTSSSEDVLNDANSVIFMPVKTHFVFGSKALNGGLGDKAGDGFIINFYLKNYDVTYKSDNNGVVSGVENEKVAFKDTPSGTTITPNTNYETIYYTCDKAVKLLDDTIVNVSDEILDVTNVVVEDNLTFTAHNRYIPLIKYQSDVGGIITGLTSERVRYNKYPLGTTDSLVPGFMYLDKDKKTVSCNKDIKLKDGVIISAGEYFKTSQILNIETSEDIVITYYHRLKPDLNINARFIKDEYHYKNVSKFELSVINSAIGSYSTDIKLKINKSDLYDIKNLNANNLSIDIDEKDEYFELSLSKLDRDSSLIVTGECKLKNLSDIHEKIDLSYELSYSESEDVINGNISTKIYANINTDAVKGFITSGTKIYLGGSYNVFYGGYDEHYLDCIKLNNNELDKDIFANKVSLIDIVKDYDVEVAYKPYVVLDVIKETDKFTYQSSEKTKYKITITNKTPKSVAENVIVSDYNLTRGSQYDLDSFKLDDGIFNVLNDYSSKISYMSLAYGESKTISYETYVDNEVLDKPEVETDVIVTCANINPKQRQVVANTKVNVYNKIKTKAINGTITDTMTYVKYGDSAEIKYEPDFGYRLKSLLVDNVYYDIKKYPNSYKISNVVDNHEIVAEFEKIPITKVTPKEVIKSVPKLIKTGDTIHVLPFLILFILSLSMIIYFRKKKR